MRGLDTSVMGKVLHGVIAKETSIQDMVKECKEIKKLKELQEVFVKETGVQSWTQAER